MNSSGALNFSGSHHEIDHAIKRAGIHENAHSYEAALKEFHKAISLIQQQRKLDRTLQLSKARCYLQMGKINMQQQRPEQALAELSHAAGIFETLNQTASLVRVLEAMGDVEMAREQYEAAMNHFRQGTCMLENSNLLALSGKTMVSWAAALAELGENRQAGKKLSEGVSRASKLEDPSEYAKVLGRAAKVSRSLGNEEDLVSYLEKQVYVQSRTIDQLRYDAESSKPVENSSQSSSQWQKKLDDLIEEKNEELRQFTRKAAHDMKEPLRMIGSFGGLLKRQYQEKLGEGGNEYIDIILDANTRMTGLLVKLLEYVKVGTIEREPDHFELSDAVLLASNALKDKIEARNAVIETGNLPVMRVHREYIVQLLTRVIDNAIHYNSSSQPVVHIDSETRPHEHLITVSDNGIGIEKSDWEKIFDLFLRLHGRDDYSGSGIGLATAMKIANFYNGRMWVESVPGKGSTFYLSIPKS